MLTQFNFVVFEKLKTKIMKKLLLLIIPLLLSCQKNIKNIDFNTIKDPCELVDVGVMICNEAQKLFIDIAEGKVSEKQKLNFAQKHAELENAWFEGFQVCVDKNRWEDDIRYCEKFNEMMRLWKSNGLLH